MDVAVGSENPVKRAAVARALPDAAVTAVSVESGVSAQPVGRAETVRGARTRAERALDGHDLSVGVESGVADLDGVDGTWLVMWAAATDGQRWGTGGGPTVLLPADVAARVDAGEALGPVMDDVLGEAGVAERQGAIGALTAGLVDRETALVSAVAGALGPFLTERY